MRRANAVAAVLAQDGVPPSSMVVIGRGENDLRVPTPDGVGEPQKPSRRDRPERPATDVYAIILPIIQRAPLAPFSHPSNEACSLDLFVSQAANFFQIAALNAD